MKKMKIIINSVTLTLTVFLNSVELSLQAENGHNLDLNLRLGISSTSGSSLQNEKRAENQRKHIVVGRTPLGPGTYALPLRRKADTDLSLSLAPPGRKVLRPDQQDYTGILGSRKADTDTELSLSLAPPGHKVLRSYQHDKTGISGRRKADSELSLSLAPPSLNVLRPNQHVKPGISGLPLSSRYPFVRISECIFYEAAPNDFRIIVGSIPVVVRNHFIIGRLDHGYLRPIFNHLLKVIKIGRIRGVPFHAVMSPEEILVSGMNKPIKLEHTIIYYYRPPVPALNGNQHNQ